MSVDSCDYYVNLFAND